MVRVARPAAIGVPPLASCVRELARSCAYITVTATATADVGPTPYYIRQYENTSPPNILATCGSGTTCSASLTKPNITGTVVVGTIIDASGNSQLGEPPYVILNWLKTASGRIGRF